MPYPLRSFTNLTQLPVARTSAGIRRGLFAQRISVTVVLRKLDPSNIPPRAPALPRFPSKFPPLARGAGREDMMT